MKKTTHILVVLCMLLALIAAAGCSSGDGNGGAAAGQNSVVVAQSAAAITDCPNGGIKVDAGIDTNSNGVLDSNEITSTQFVCNGTNGVSAGVTVSTEPAGANCANGGTKISVGPDANGDGVPDTVTSVDYICNGTDSATLKVEQCLICHGPGTVANISDMHALSSQSTFTAPLTVIGGLVDINMQNGAQLAGIRMTGTVDLVTINTVTPVVDFTVTDGAGHGIIGLNSNLTGTSTVNNLRVTLAQLVESPTNTFPSYWQSYEVASATSRPTDEGTAAGFVDHGNGKYTYTMNKNVTTVPGVTYVPTNTHRLAIRVFGAVAGGTLNEEPLDLTRDFVPSAGPGGFPGAPIEHNIVAEGACDACHYQLGITTPHGGRDDPKYCVMCHTYQRANGRTATVPNASGVMTGSTNIVSGQVDLVNSDPTSTAGGYASGEFVRLIHQIHKGDELSLKGYNYGGVLYNEVTYPQDVRKCTTCHAGTQGGRHLTNPSRKACGACHDNITWASIVLPGFIGHSGGSKPDDTGCSGCHPASDIANVHVAIAEPDPNSVLAGGTNNNTNAACVVASNDTPPPGAIVVNYNVVSVGTTSVNGAQRPTITFSISLDGTLRSFNTDTTGQLFPDFVGSPSVQFAWAVPQDGITTPADFNASASGYIKNIWNGTATGTGAGSLVSTASPTYTITLTGVKVASNATMLTGGVGYTYGLTNTPPLTQTTGYNIVDKNVKSACTFSVTNVTTGVGVGGLIVPALDKYAVASGYTGRRIAVDTAKCNACHGHLGANPSFHAGQRNDAPTCSFCHNPNRTSSGWSANASTFVHAIHAAAKRTVPYTWHAVSATENFSDITYPLSGDNSDLLKKCDACHVAGYNDFSASAYTSNGGALMNNLLWTTVATGTLASSSTSSFAFSPYVTLDKDYGSGFSFSASTGVGTDAAGTTLVSSPISAACFACHDSDAATAHIKTNGGTLYDTRSNSIK